MSIYVVAPVSLCLFLVFFRSPLKLYILVLTLPHVLIFFFSQVDGKYVCHRSVPIGGTVEIYWSLVLLCFDSVESVKSGLNGCRDSQ